MYSIKQNNIAVRFDDSGSLVSIIDHSDQFESNFLGNPDNVTNFPDKPVWTGNIFSKVWQTEGSDTDIRNHMGAHIEGATINDGEEYHLKGEWNQQCTWESHDTRNIKQHNNRITISYTGKSKNPGGITDYKLTQEYYFDEKNRINCEIEIENNTDHILELGTLGFTLTSNKDYKGVYGKESPLEQVQKGKYNQSIAFIHEQKVLEHLFIAGHSSYVLLNRPAGIPKHLLLHTEMDTPLEDSFDCPSHPFTNVLAIHNWAGRDTKRPNYGINGETSLLLEIGEKKKFKFIFSLIEDFESIQTAKISAGNLGIKIFPSMVVTENAPVYIILESWEKIHHFEKLADNIKIIHQENDGDKINLVVSFKYRGQKTLRVIYGENKWTNLHFYCVEDIAQLIKARSQFIINRQFYDNPDDQYNRHHMFLPFDYNQRRPLYHSDEVWEVGGSDEFGFSEPLYLAEKNVHLPNQSEVDTLETYIEDCLFKHIQDPETYKIRASLYYVDRTPSSMWSHWPEYRSKTEWRTYNYPHPANIYHALYRIGKYYDILKKKGHLDYLKMSYKSCIAWFTSGHWPHIGLMCGSNATNILDDLKNEGWNKEYETLRKHLFKCNTEFTNDPYPYGSELIIDQTAHEQVYYFSKYFNNQEKAQKTLEIIKSLRAGNQPAWFTYGNDKRGMMSCWYSETLNGMALLDGYGNGNYNDMDMFVKGYAGMMSIMANILPDGMGFGWFIYDSNAHEHAPPRTLDNGIAMYGYFQGIRSYVMNLDGFGLVGFGCLLESDHDIITVMPNDGIRKRVCFYNEKINIEATSGEIEKIDFDKNNEQIRIRLCDSTNLVNTGRISITGIDNHYTINYNNEKFLPYESGKTIICELTNPEIVLTKNGK